MEPNHWHAVYVKSRTEKKTAERLSAHFDVFCPTRIERRKWSDRVKKVEVPLFNGYIFYRGDEQTRLQILQDPHVVRSVFWNKKLAIIRDHEIEMVKNLISSFEQIETKPLEKGEKVSIISGPFSEIIGEVIKNNGDKVRVVLETLGVALEAQIDEENLKRIKEQSTS